MDEESCNYTWTQTLSEVSLSFPVLGHTKSNLQISAKDVECVITANSLYLKLKSSSEALAKGRLFDRVIVEESFWQIGISNSKNSVFKNTFYIKSQRKSNCYNDCIAQCNVSNLNRKKRKRRESFNRRTSKV